jgi:hypothetical protein
MLSRCYSIEDPYYKDYGGRGITVCDRWKPNFDWVGGKLTPKEAFLNFYSDLGPKPSPTLSLDRYPNNDGNYELSNCRWATARQQQHNRRDNVKKVA